MFRKAFVTLAVAAVAGIMASSAKAAVNLSLTIVASPTPGPVTDPFAPDSSATQFIGGTWQVFGTLTGDTASTLGLAGIQLSVTGGGDIAVEDYNLGDGALGTNFDLPFGTFGTGNGSISGSGFALNESTGSGGVNIAGFLSPHYRKGTGANSTITSIVEGIGLTAGSYAGYSWDNPVLIADGYYTGTAGTLTVSAKAVDVNLLPATLPAPTTGQGTDLQTNYIDTVNGVGVSGTGSNFVAIGIPEPASMGMLALGGLALLARRRKNA